MDERHTLSQRLERALGGLAVADFALQADEGFGELPGAVGDAGLQAIAGGGEVGIAGLQLLKHAVEAVH